MKESEQDLRFIVDMLWYSWSVSVFGTLGPRELSLTATSAESLSQSAKSFVELDKMHLVETPVRIREIWSGNFELVIGQHSQEVDKMMSAINRKRKLPGLSSIFSQSKNVISALKPCWVMSPLSVSMLRPPAGWFDVVIFDEASQVLPADAITSIKAAKQVIVAGDDRQLPPSPFFASGEIEDDDAQDDVDDDAIHVGHYESILSLMKFVITKPRQLRWHYRSRDEKLIAFSNNYIYKNLITFPDSIGESCLRFERVDGGRNSVSKKATNPAEVDRVVELIQEHSRIRPMESLGVIALGMPHATAIQDALAIAVSEDEVLDDFLNSDLDEPFFVKNLERVQGDERDAVILTVGYGRNDRGEISYNFGPINGKFGERRLNVAVTRAKNRMTVVSSFGHAELDEERCKEGGRAFLRDFLRYVESNGSEFGDSRLLKAEMNAFERSIYNRLLSAGLKVVPQYGIGRYRIDFAVANPENPSEFILAVECDGASYHSQPTARERDRLRQEALERRGWVFHRIWSTDWFRDPEHEMVKLLDAVNSSLTLSKTRTA
jgi:very-short-patch-repair endonuclease